MLRLFLILCVCWLPCSLRAEPNGIAILTIDGPIGPATAQYLREGIEQADQSASLIVIRINTLGGLLSSTLDITQSILNAKTPIVSYVSPNGASATSAGAFIVYASPIAAMAPATNIGASSPIPLGGDTPYAPPQESTDAPDSNDAKDTSNASSSPAAPSSTAQVKAIEDLTARMETMANLHGRNAKAAIAMVSEGASFTVEEALAQNIINLKAQDMKELLHQLDGYALTLHGQSVTLATNNVPTYAIEQSWKNEILGLLTHPNIVYVLMLIGIYGILLEFYNPGGFYPGIIGAICLLLAGYSLHILPMNITGLGLIALGVLLIIVEFSTPSYGIFGIGGAVAFILGSLFLFDPNQSAFHVANWLIALMAIITGFAVYVVMYFAMRSHTQKPVSGSDMLIGLSAKALCAFDANTPGQVLIQGSAYRAETKDTIAVQQTVYIVNVRGIVVIVSATPPKER